MHEQAAQITVPTPAQASHALASPARMLPRNKSYPGRELSTRGKSRRVGNSCDDRGSRNRADSGDGSQTLPRGACPAPFPELPLQSEYTNVDGLDLSSEREKH